MEIKKFIRIYDDVFPLFVLKNFTKMCGHFNYEKTKLADDSVNENVRKVQGRFLSNMKESLTEAHWFNLLHHIFTTHCVHYIQSQNLDVRLDINVHDIQILKYNTSNFYNWHVDDGYTTPRTLSCIYFVNDNYKGGNLCFRNPDTTNEHTIEKKSNRLIVWPSSFLYPHTVKPVLEGERLSVVAWAR